MNEQLTEGTENRKADKRVVYLDRIDDHPLNRHFDQHGPAWDALVESVRLHGVINMPLLRYMEDGRYQAVAGHRRKAAALAAGLVKIDCTVRKMTDREALELLVIDNLEREDPDPVEEGKLLRALLADGVEVEALAFRLNRKVEWIKTRQGMLELGDEVLDAVRKPKDDEGHLNLGTVSLLLALPIEERPRGVQMVLHPEFKLGVLNTREAADILKHEILEPVRKRKEWEKECRSLVKAWRARLSSFLTREEKKDLLVEAVSWDNVGVLKQARNAEDLLRDVPGVNTEVVDDTKRWVHLAIRNGIPIWIEPADNEAQSNALVAGELLVMAEAARAQHGTEYWIGAVKKQAAPAAGTSDIEHSTPNNEGVEEEKSEAVADALHVLGGDGERDYQEEEKPDVVIEQSFERSMYMNVTPVMKMQAWAEGQLRRPPEKMEDMYPDGLVPKWMDDRSFGPQDIKEVCDWILSLKA